MISILVAVLAAVLALPAGSFAAASAHTYSDIDRESPASGAPDIASVVVSRTASGLVSFRIVFAKPVRITPDMGFDVWINADPGEQGISTGDGDGLDYTLDFSRDVATRVPYASVYAYANGKEYQARPPSFAFSKSVRAVVFQISTRDTGLGLSKQLARGGVMPYLPELGDRFAFYVGAGPNWDKADAPVDWTPTWTFPPSRATGGPWQLIGGAALLLMGGVGGAVWLVTRQSRRGRRDTHVGAVGTEGGHEMAHLESASPRVGPQRELWVVLAVHAALLPVYMFWGLVGAASSPSSPAWGSFALMGAIWLIIGGLLVQWWKEGRHGLVQRAVTWALLAWLTLFLLLLLPFRATRKLLVPSPVEPPQAVGVDQLAELRDLHDSGVLTDDEFEAKKTKVLTEV